MAFAERRYSIQPEGTREAEIVSAVNKGARDFVGDGSVFRNSGLASNLRQFRDTLHSLSNTSSFVVSHKPEILFRGVRHHLFKISTDQGALGVFYQPRHETYNADIVELPQDGRVYIVAIGQNEVIESNSPVLSIELKRQGTTTSVAQRIPVVNNNFKLLGYLNPLISQANKFWAGIETVLQEYTTESGLTRFISLLPANTSTGSKPDAIHKYQRRRPTI